MVSILIIGNEVDNGNLLKPVLDRLDFQVTYSFAETEDTFLEYISAEPDLLIAMEVANGFSGLDAAEVLKRTGREKPMVFVAEKEDEQQALQYAEAGASHYLSVGNLDKLKQVIYEASNQHTGGSSRGYRYVFENNPSPQLVVKRDDYEIVNANKAAADLLGYEEADLRGRQLATLQPERNIEMWIDPESQDVEGHSRMRLVTGNSRIAYIMHISPSFEMEDGTFKIISLGEEDTAADTDHGEDLQWLEEVAPILTDIVHYFQNTYTVIRGYATLLAGKDTLISQRQMYLGKLNSVIEKDESMLEKLGRTCSEELDDQKQRVNVNELIRSVIGAITAGETDPPHIIEALDAQRPAVQGYKKGLQNMVTYLGRNAVEACANGGIVTISTESTDHSVYIVVSDTGRGMAPAIRRECLRPFVTTKDGVRGAGLGLSMAGAIIKRHGGNLSITSEPAVGTTVRVCLPI